MRTSPHALMTHSYVYRPNNFSKSLVETVARKTTDHATPTTKFPFDKAGLLHPAFWRRGCALRDRGTSRLVGDVHTEYAEGVAHLGHEVSRHRVAITREPELPVPQHAYDTRYSV